jgi:hypothetical protein
MKRGVRWLNSERTRRGTVAGLVTLLAGCSTSNSSQQPQSDPEPQQNTTEQPPAEEEPSQPEGTQQDGKGEQAEDDEEEQADASDWNWNDVLQAEREAKQFNANQRYPGLGGVVEGALEGEEIGRNLEDIDNNAYEYSHGGQTWNLEHFQNLDLTHENEFKQAVNDALTVTNHYMNTKEGDFNSEWNSEMGDAAQIILEEAHNTDNLHIWPWSNDQHGFNYVLSEDHGVFTADGATPAIGRAGTNPLEDAPYGNDIVSQFDESWVDPNSDVPGFQANTIQNFLTNGIYDGLLDVNENAVGYQLGHIPDLIEKYKQEDSGEFLWNVHRPAVATTVNRLARDIDEEEQLIAINPDSLEDLPDLREYDKFQTYRNRLEQHTTVMDVAEYDGVIGLGEKQD